MSAMKYRPDIDGLRAVAVTSIVIFHLGLGVFPGGFVGVDIFFVISGFLISRLALSDPGAFSISEFYVRRILRILPALAAVLVVCSIVALKLFYATELVEYAKSAISASFFSANIYFFSTFNYFSPSAEEIPLLHLWSLGVEEQFYIFFPLVILLIVRRSDRFAKALFGVIGISSLIASQWMLGTNPLASFYLIPFRAFELLMGCYIALPTIKAFQHRLASHIEFLLGLIAVCWSILDFDRFTSFPGVAAVLPCLGAAAIIHAGCNETNGLAAILGSKPLVAIGKLSYSLYLVHWPIIVFGRRIFPNANPYLFALTVLLFSLITAFALRSVIEEPARKWRATHNGIGVIKIFSASAISVVSFASFCAFVVYAQGFPDRQDSRIANIAAYGHYDMASSFRQRTCFLDPDQHAAQMDFSSCLPRGSGEKVILWGDSHAAMLAAGLGESLEAKGYSFGFMSASACAPAINYDAPGRPNCREFNDVAFPLILKAHPNIVIMTAEYGITVGAQIEQLDATIRILAGKGIRVVLLGISPYYKRSVPQLVLERIQSGRSLAPAPEELKRDYLDPTEDLIGRRFANRSDVKYISVLGIMCPSYKCPLVTGDDVPVHFDQAHLTVAGSKLFAKELTPFILSGLPPKSGRSDGG